MIRPSGAISTRSISSPAWRTPVTARRRSGRLNFGGVRVMEGFPPIKNPHWTEVHAGEQIGAVWAVRRVEMKNARRSFAPAGAILARTLKKRLTVGVVKARSAPRGHIPAFIGFHCQISCGAHFLKWRRL